MLFKLIYFCIYFSYIVMSAYLPAYLVTLGYSDAKIGVIYSVMAVIVIIAQVSVGILFDNFKNKKIILNILTLVSIFSLLGIMMTGNLLFLITLGYAFMALIPVIDSLFIANLDNPDDFGKYRAFGSVGAAFGILLGGVVVEIFSGSSIFLFCAFFIIVIMIGINFRSWKESVGNEKYLPASKKLLTNKNFLLLMLITIFVYGPMVAQNAYSFSYFTEMVLLTSVGYGLFGFFMIFFEGIVMNFQNKLHEKNTYKKLLMIAALFGILRWLGLTFLYDYKIVILIIGLIQGIVIGIFIPTVIILINKIAPPNTNATGMSLFQSSIHLGGMIVGLVAAAIASQLELNYVFLVFAVFVGIGLIFISRLKVNDANNR